MTEKNKRPNKNGQPNNLDALTQNNLWYIFCSKIDHFITKHPKVLAILSLILFSVFTMDWRGVDSSKTFFNNPIVLITIVTISVFSILTKKYYPTLYIRIRNIMHFIQDWIFLLLVICSPLVILLEWSKNTFIKLKIIDLQTLDNINIGTIFICLFALMMFINRPIMLIIKSYMQLKNPKWKQYEPSLGQPFILLFILISAILVAIATNFFM